MEWPDKTLLTADDTESIRWLLDCALYSATRSGHVGDIYDMARAQALTRARVATNLLSMSSPDQPVRLHSQSPTCWAIWMVQNQHALKTGGWTVETPGAQYALSFEGLYSWLLARHERRENKNLYDPVTHRLLKRYKLPFKHMSVPPRPDSLFKWVKGARRLSEWIRGCQMAMDERDRPRALGFALGIIQQRPPELVASPPQASEAAARRRAIWERVTSRARVRRRGQPLRTAQEDSDDAQLTREVVAAVVQESDDARDIERDTEQSTETTASITEVTELVSDDELERELEEALRGEEEEPMGARDEPARGGPLTLDEIEDLLMQD